MGRLKEGACAKDKEGHKVCAQLMLAIIILLLARIETSTSILIKRLPQEKYIFSSPCFSLKEISDPRDDWVGQLVKI